ncbi:electron transporter RnfE [Flavobacterium sp. ALD4]|nr:electron transporter RnfE [Flavobacterium sp. ALD4]
MEYGCNVLIWVSLVLFCVFFLYRILHSSNKSKPSESESPLDILKRRYANGGTINSRI